MGRLDFTLKPIGFIHSCYKEKFGIPRQAGLVKQASAELMLPSEQISPDALRGLEQFSHIWLIFIFHATQAAGWHPTVRPPRLGGNKRLGVFATRSTFRPNPLGLSVVQLVDIQFSAKKSVLFLSGIDLLDGTPVLDIKPYLPYVDCVTEAQAGFATSAPKTALEVCFSAVAMTKCLKKAQQWQVDMVALITQLLQQDPRPAYRLGKLDKRPYRMKLYDFDLCWHYQDQHIQVMDLFDT